jgi:uncharacterized protein YecE (DUF72 family)
MLPKYSFLLPHEKLLSLCPPLLRISRFRLLLGKTEGKILDQNSIRIGTSGWSYKEWEGVLYPNSKTPKLTFYSSIFNTAEIDSTFYANPSKGLVLGWVRNTPDNFQFSVKLPQSITHQKQLDLRAGAEIDLVEFLDLIDPLREAGKLGPLLIQLPPSFAASKMEKLKEFLDAIPNKKDYYKFAIEFRNKSWLEESEKVNELLREYNVAKTIVDEPLLPVDLTVTADFSFIRWHGHGQRPWYNYRYKEDELEPWVDRVNKAMRKTTRIYGYFNNHFHGYAVENGLEFLQKLNVATEEQKMTLAKLLESIEGRGKLKEPEGAEVKPQKRKMITPGQKTLSDF